MNQSVTYKRMTCVPRRTHRRDAAVGTRRETSLPFTVGILGALTPGATPSTATGLLSPSPPLPHPWTGVTRPRSSPPVVPA